MCFFPHPKVNKYLKKSCDLKDANDTHMLSDSEISLPNEKLRTL